MRATVALARRTETASVTPKLHYPKLGIPDSVAVVYNTFPMPPNDSDMSRLGALGQAVADARAAHPGATLADLYDPDLMPSNLRRAHQVLDRAVDRLYRQIGFASERERVEHLFMRYEKMYTPLESASKSKRRKRRSKKAERRYSDFESDELSTW